ncbi:hypothetical protein Dimus_034039 [Dionaea muscipula]
MLNPCYYYKESLLQADDAQIVMDGVIKYAEHLLSDDEEGQNNVINIELVKYKNKDGAFGKALARKGCERNDDNYVPEQKEKERDVLLASKATNAQEWIVEGGYEEVELGSGLTWKAVGEAMRVEEILQPRRSSRNVGVRELHEEDLVSDEGEQVEEDFDFESDEDRVLEGHGEKEEEIRL